MRTTRSIITRIASVLAVLVLAVSTSAHAQTQNDRRASEDDERPTFILRTYEVGDLIVNVPNYAAPGGAASTPSAPTAFGGGGGMGGGGFGAGGGGFGGGVPAGPAVGGGGLGAVGGNSHDPLQITFDSLIDAITSVVAPDTWQENGTGEGDIKPVGAALAVYQTLENHQRLAEFLDMLRQGSAKRRTLTIDARWLMLDSQDLASLVDDEGKINRDKLQSFTRRPTSMRGITNCFSGQLVYLVSGTRRNVVSGYIPVVGSVEQPDENLQFAWVSNANPQGADVFLTQLGDDNQGDINAVAQMGGKSVGYQPVVEKPNFGVLLEIRPTVVQGENAAVVDLKSTVTFPGQPAADVLVPSTFDPAMGAAPRVDRLAVEMQELATTMRLPLGEPMLVGGMTYLTPPLRQTTDAGSDATEPQADSSETPQLYLVLEIQ